MQTPAAMQTKFEFFKEYLNSNTYYISLSLALRSNRPTPRFEDSGYILKNNKKNSISKLELIKLIESGKKRAILTVKS